LIRDESFQIEIDDLSLNKEKRLIFKTPFWSGVLTKIDFKYYMSCGAIHAAVILSINPTLHEKGPKKAIALRTEAVNES
jgi:hypothetical protein